MLTEDEVQELTRRAAAEEEGGEEDPLERKLRLGQLLNDDEVEELTRRAVEAEEMATDVAAGVMDEAVEAMVRSPRQG